MPELKSPEIITPQDTAEIAGLKYVSDDIRIIG